MRLVVKASQAELLDSIVSLSNHDPQNAASCVAGIALHEEIEAYQADGKGCSLAPLGYPLYSSFSVQPVSNKFARAIDIMLAEYKPLLWDAIKDKYRPHSNCPALENVSDMSMTLHHLRGVLLLAAACALLGLLVHLMRMASSKASGESQQVLESHSLSLEEQIRCRRSRVTQRNMTSDLVDYERLLSSLREDMPQLFQAAVVEAMEKFHADGLAGAGNDKGPIDVQVEL
eukprot:TRINITY_DN26212_c0_g1_i1.p1 TRINITY_DN26212_c0_g1~~TRINITY_DN26212_c0_g1_i1.p1  ORF type:complete len:262 (-),score=25.85 TRINITY_DN26212_c0_g1_i1:64-753(-)